MSEIVPIRKGLEPQPPPGTVNLEVVNELQGLLDKAQAGEITGIAYVSLHAGDTTTYYYAGRITRGLLGAITLLQLMLGRTEDLG